MIELNHLYNEDFRITTKRMPDNFVDSIVTDPPYELKFMGKKWDNSGIAYNVEGWRECLRVLKPGGYLLAFGGTRTQHRMVCAIEDAGFEIRDTILWLYGSGFPKSLDIGKAIDKTGGQSLSWFIDYILKVADEKGISRRELTMLFPSKNGNPTGWLWNKQKTQGITIEQFNTIKDFLQLPFDNIKETEREIIGRGKAGLTAGTIANFAGEKEFDLTRGTSEWEGYGTALKPACEMICMARKPLSEKTVAQNVLKWHTGGINIDASRIKYKNESDKASAIPQGRITSKDGHTGVGAVVGGVNNIELDKEKWIKEKQIGRFPANVILSDDEEVLSQFPNTESGKMKQHINGGDFNVYAKQYPRDVETIGDSGSAARFFYIAKADQQERQDGCHEMEKKPSGMISNTSGQHITRCDGGAPAPKGNNHPTVKPLKLIQYLQRMVTHKGGITYDPFGGSGTSAMAASNEQFKWIMSELIKEHYEIALKRIYNNNGLFT
jgi:DNA modification methylase